MRNYYLMAVFLVTAMFSNAQKLYEANQQAMDTLWENSNSSEWHFNDLDELKDRDGIPTIKLQKRYGGADYGYPILELNLSNNNIKGELPNFTSGIPAGYKSTSSGDDSKYAFQSPSPVIKFSHNNINSFSPYLAYTSMGTVMELWLDNNKITNGYIGCEETVKGRAHYIYTGLNVYCVHNNEITSFPLSNLGLDLYLGYSSISNSAELVRVDNNRISFKDLIPLKDKLKECTAYISYHTKGNPDFKFIYSPQKSIGGDNSEVTLTEGKSKTLSFNLSHPDNVYSWTLNGKDLPLSKVNDYTIDALSTDNAGVYRCKVTNPKMKDLTLYSYDMAVWLKKEGNNNPSDIALSNNEATPGIFRFAVIGTLTGTDPNNDKLYFRLDDRVADNAMFRIINGNTLICADELFTIPYINDYTIKVQAYDIYGGKLEKEFTIVKGDGNPDVEIPTDITISNHSFPENTIGYAIDTVDAVGVNNRDYVFSLPNGVMDNDKFFFDIDTLKVKDKFNFETSNDRYVVRVELSSGDSFKLNKDLELWVTDKNDAPSEIILTGAEFVYDVKPGSMVGILIASDEDPTDKDFTFSLVSGDGDINIAQFLIEGTYLKTKSKFSSSDIGEKSVRIRVEDDEGAFYEKSVTIKVNDMPADPYAQSIEISRVICNENQTGKVKVGELIIRNGNFNEFTFSLANGDGDTDNNLFIIDNNIIYTETSFNYEAKSIYNIRVKAVNGDVSLEKSVDISVNNINEAPLSIHPDNTFINSEWEKGHTICNLLTMDPDGDASFEYEKVGGSHAEYINVEGNSLKVNKKVDKVDQNVLSVNVKVSDKKGGEITQTLKFFKPDVSDENKAPSAIGINNFLLQHEWNEGTNVCILIAKDTESANNHVFSLVDSEDDNNDFFRIENDLLVLAKKLDGNKNSYNVNVMVSDLLGEEYTQKFTLYVPSHLNGNNVISADNVSASVYPNPVINKLKCEIDSEYSGNVDIDVMDVKGLLIKSKSVDKNSGNFVTEIDLEDLTQGIYFVKFMINHKIETVTVFKN